MIKKLEKVENSLYHFKDGKKIVGAHSDLWGNCTGLRGECTVVVNNSK